MSEHNTNNPFALNQMDYFIRNYHDIYWNKQIDMEQCQKLCKFIDLNTGFVPPELEEEFLLRIMDIVV
jgi:hypothetical protein